MLYPLRIDVKSPDKSARIIDTLLIDPNCLPITPSTVMTEENRKRSYRTLTLQKIEQNSEYLASTIIADMEVHGVSKTNKSARLSLGGLKSEVKNQIQKQLEAIQYAEESGVVPREIKKIKQVEEQTTQANDTVEKKKEERGEEFVKINLRIRENGVQVIDEFLVDPKLPSSDPITLAKAIVDDLDIPEDFIVNSIAISIAEQMYGGLTVGEDLQGMTRNAPTTNTQVAPMSSKVAVKRNVPSAWYVDEQEDTVARTHFVAMAKARP